MTACQPLGNDHRKFLRFALWLTAMCITLAVTGMSAPAWMRAITPIGASKGKSPFLLDVRVAAFF
jgi:hypothetical protein